MKFTFLLAVFAAVSTNLVSEAADAKVLGAAVATSLDSPATSSELPANEMHRKLPGDEDDENEDGAVEDEDEGGVNEEDENAYGAVEDEDEGEYEDEYEQDEDDLEEENEMNMAYAAGAVGSATVILASLGVLESRRRVRVKTPTIDLNDNIQTDYVSAANIEVV
eukprot:CAMPEP_0197729380 /NCGR_PEP_ID=MMETSP1434-20131217/30350_1 /TAXON_ID=265543 /ORGANISM="Minutocellus polymorphus, Strain CCMP3303" /LENGTH=164 /DNA_ID=CAMNT_0043316003 /DNA_START=38 /DNA_END=532 /DNA_ORIENTATION=+